MIQIVNTTSFAVDGVVAVEENGVLQHRRLQTARAVKVVVNKIVWLSGGVVVVTRVKLSIGRFTRDVGATSRHRAVGIEALENGKEASAMTTHQLVKTGLLDTAVEQGLVGVQRGSGCFMGS